MKTILQKLYQHQTLSSVEAEETLKGIAKNQFNTSQIASFLTIYNMRDITIAELAGFRDALLDLCHTVNLGPEPVIDMCGTGGDGKNTFNISTLAAFVVAGAGVKVAKHGNYGVSSICGSSNVLQELGLKFTADEATLQHQIEQANICILHAPLFHPAMKAVAHVRKDLATPTFFNMLGPMINPANPRFQLVGVNSLDLARKYQYLYQDLSRQYTIIHALDGYDEISLTGPAKCIRPNQESVSSPEELQFQQLSPEALYGGQTIEAAVKIFKTILANQGSKPQHDVVIANAATALQCRLSIPFQEAKALAEESLHSKKALHAFTTLNHLSQ